MAKQKLYAITRLSATDAVFLDIGGTRFDIAQYTASFACNEIPMAQVMVAVGRHVPSGAYAAAHNPAVDFHHMQPASVWFTPQGDYAPDGTKWPAGPQKIFDGYFTGWSNQKINGKTALVANLTHWLIDLACSSCVSMNSHPGNPAQLSAAAVFQNLSSTNAAQSAFISQLAGQEVVSSVVQQDLWKGIKELFAKLANIRARAVAPVSDCYGDGLGSHVANTRALRALKRIEGPCVVAEADLAYDYGVALPVDTLGINSAQEAIANAVCQATVESYAYTTFWDKMVGELFPMFHMAIVPMVDTAIVIADTPAYNGNYWKLIRPDDEDSFQQSHSLERPLRAVGVMGDYGSIAGAKSGPVGGSGRVGLVGGCFVAGAVSADDGVVQYIKPPMWLTALQTAKPAAGDTTGAGKLTPVKTLDLPGVTASDLPLNQQYNTIVSSANGLYGKYAQAVYVANMLRGSYGIYSGKLRFDIAPGSILKMTASQEKFIGAEDNLAKDLFANVARVTIAINCESSIASTTFQLSHLRTENQNKSLRYSVPEHPLFMKNLHGSKLNPVSHGCPLLPAYDFNTED